VWLKNLKIAIIEKDTNKLEKLMKDIPSLSDYDEIVEALFLLREATILVTELKDKTFTSMQKMQKHISFLKATEAPPHFKRLNITS